MKSRFLMSTLASIFSINNKNKVTQIYSPSLKKYSQALVFLKVLPKATNDIA